MKVGRVPFLHSICSLFSTQQLNVNHWNQYSLAWFEGNIILSYVGERIRSDLVLVYQSCPHSLQSGSKSFNSMSLKKRFARMYTTVCTGSLFIMNAMVHSARFVCLFRDWHLLPQFCPITVCGFAGNQVQGGFKAEVMHHGTTIYGELDMTSQIIN